ncbi:MAG: hypothetical protein KC897_06365 [Candidatus Omnitrophica bacterium]|nr:hypothetical protein [Candidatus Omnitrophota bacterium]MCB9719586.1 hypothetical protein [Candidatus Omnitrophota bacterium]
MKDRTSLYIALIISGLAFLQFVVLPTIRTRTSMTVINSIMADWQSANHITPMNYWINRNKYPTLPRLVTFKMRNRQVLKKDDELSARFILTLNFEPNPSVPQNSDWLFVLKKAGGDWKVADFRLSKLHPSDIKQQAARYDAAADRARLQQMENDRTAKSLEHEAQKSQPKTQASEVKPLRPIPMKPVETTPEDQTKRPGYRAIPAYVD